MYYPLLPSSMGLPFLARRQAYLVEESLEIKCINELKN
jgi:hypothetical protein